MRRILRGRAWNWRRYSRAEWWWRRLGRTGAVSLVVLGAIAVGVALIDRLGGGGGEARELAARIASDGQDPVALLVRAARARRFVFLADVAGAAAPKRIAAEAVAAIGERGGLDAVVLELPASEQETIDRYFESDPEDASILVSNPRLVADDPGLQRAQLEIFRAVWRLNQDLGPTRRIRVVAADLPEWPPPRSLSPEQAARVYAQRDAYMADRIRTEVLDWDPQARVLLFVGGYRALRSGRLRLQSGGGTPVDVTPLAARLAERYPAEVYTALVDQSPWRTVTGPVAEYSGTRFYTLVRDHLPELERPAALPVGEAFAFLPNPLRETSAPALTLQILPAGYRLADVADAYIFVRGRIGVQL